MLNQIRQRVTRLQQQDEPVGQAAVLIPVTDEPEPQLLLTRRADHLDKHAGEVAFPGGKRDEEDRDLFQTVLRETHEEIGLPEQAVELLGVMPSARSKYGLQVVPFVGLVDPTIDLTPNQDELDEIFSVPLSFFKQNQPNDLYEFSYQAKRYRVPCFNYRGRIIWGLTAHFIAEFMNKVFDTDITIGLRADGNAQEV